MTYQLRSFLVLVLVGITSICGLTQSAQTAAQRPKIGLVLQGGGALGLAHVGVITWLEEHHIPIDYVAGTSMGGLVGVAALRTSRGLRAEHGAGTATRRPSCHVEACHLEVQRRAHR